MDDLWPHLAVMALYGRSGQVTVTKRTDVGIHLGSGNDGTPPLLRREAGESILPA